MAESGYHVVVLTSRSGASPEDASVHGNIRVIRLPCWHFMEDRFSIPFPVFAPRLLVELWRQVKQADVVHIHDVFYISSWAAAFVAAIVGRPILLTQHVALVEHPSRMVMLVQRLVYGTMGRCIFSLARTIVAYNRNVLDFLRHKGVPESKLLLLGNGIDTALFSPPTPAQRLEIRGRLGLPADRKLVLFVGRLVEKKGYRILLGAHDPAFELVFAGPGDIPPNGHVQGVHWMGPLDQQQTRDLYQACDLFAFPAAGEIFTLAMQEAMACGLPVVTTDDPAYIDSVSAGVTVLCRRDANSFRVAIKSLLADGDRLRSLGVQSREIAVRHFEWDANFSRLMAAFSAALRQDS